LYREIASEGSLVSPSSDATTWQHRLDPHSADEYAYPRPSLRRPDWLSLDGQWDFAVSDAGSPAGVVWSLSINVPYPPESALSGLELEHELPVVWYRRRFRTPAAWQGRRLLLHFGAVDHRAEVWLNGHRAGGHEGGHTPFSIDVSDMLVDGDQELCVRAEDDPAAFDQPRGKQDWLERPHSIWYPRTTGIWQTVWLEPVPVTRIASVRLTPDLQRFAVTVQVEIEGSRPGHAIGLELSREGESLANDRYGLTGRSLTRTIHLPDPGIDDARNRFLWSPEHPNLLELSVTLHGEGGVVDRVDCYTGLRTVEARDGRFFLNGRPYYQRLVLDQGYWGDGLLTPPSGEALRHDVELAKSMGFNGVRKHQKLEDPRYLYWADRLGLLVWSELPSAYSFGSKATRRLLATWLEAIERDYNNPCVVARVPFNESWGVPDLAVSAPQRDLLAAFHRLTKSLDPTRVVVDNDGWEHGESDLFTIHDYSRDPKDLAARYGRAADLEATLEGFRPGGRSLRVVEGDVPKAVLISEFGGIRFGSDPAGWGYSEAESPESLLERLAGLLAPLRRSDAVIGFCYTQFSDTFQEQNGLLYSDRRPKLPLEALAEVIGKGGRH
jgi:hypothetical protein